MADSDGRPPGPAEGAPGPAPSEGHPSAPSGGHPRPGGHPTPPAGAAAARPSYDTVLSPVAGPAGGAPPQIEEVPGKSFVSFLKISLKRAFRLRIDNNEVLPSERASLLAASPPIVEPNLQAFLAWRRSVLFLVAVALVPLSVLGLIDGLRGGDIVPWPVRMVRLGPALAETLFCWICWQQLRHWAHWRRQRRVLFWGWLLFMTAPFLVFAYPLRTVVEDLWKHRKELLISMGVDPSYAYKKAVLPFVYSMLAMLQLAPKAISLMPGLIRASMVIKMQFPGSSAPGWLIVLAAPLYAMLAYVILIVPYQFTGSGYFMLGIGGVVLGQALLARAGYRLARPLDEAECMTHIKTVRTYYMVVMIFSAGFIVIALGSLVSMLNLRTTDVILAVLKFETNVLILTMIGSDLVVTNLDRARAKVAGVTHVEEAAELKIAAFVGLDAPTAPPPPGHGQHGGHGG